MTPCDSRGFDGCDAAGVKAGGCPWGARPSREDYDCGEGTAQSCSNAVSDWLSVLGPSGSDLSLTDLCLSDLPEGETVPHPDGKPVE